MTVEILTQTLLNECLNYDPSTGLFTWLNRPESHFKSRTAQRVWNSRLSGKTAGGNTSDGYKRITVFNQGYSAHRLAWLYMTGSFPIQHIDHINHDKKDNRLINLRAATPQDNSQNSTISSRNTSGKVGVCWNKKQREWRVHINVNKKQTFIGSFKSLPNAIASRVAAEIKHGYHPNHGTDYS